MTKFELAKDRVYRNLKSRILSGDLKSDAALRETQLAKEYGVSRTPIREALRQLVSDQLVRIVPNMGAFVGGLTWDEAREVFVLRTLLEAFAAQLTTNRITNNQAQELKKNIEKQRAAVKDGNIDAYEEYDDEYHAFLINHSGNAQLTELIEQLNDRTKLASLRHSMFSVEVNLKISLEEHEAIAEALLNKDARKVGLLVWKHGKRFYGEAAHTQMPDTIFFLPE